MKKAEKLAEILEHPERHRHDYSDLLACSTDGDAIDSEILDAHATVKLGRNGGVDCDVVSGPCACGAWH